MSEKALEMFRRSLSTYDANEVAQCARELLSEKVNVMEVVNALTTTLKEIGDKYAKGEIFLMHLAAAGLAGKKVLAEVLGPEIKRTGLKRRTLGKVVIGTVYGDIHDIGKSIIAMMLTTAGFDVYDLGVDVPVEEFIRKVKEVGADILCLSALLSTSLPVQSEVIKALKGAGIRDKVKVVIGGAPATREWAEEIAADGYADNGIDAVKIAKKLTGVR